MYIYLPTADSAHLPPTFLETQPVFSPLIDYAMCGKWAASYSIKGWGPGNNNIILLQVRHKLKPVSWRTKFSFQQSARSRMYEAK